MNRFCSFGGQKWNCSPAILGGNRIGDWCWRSGLMRVSGLTTGDSTMGTPHPAFSLSWPQPGCFSLVNWENNIFGVIKKSFSFSFVLFCFPCLDPWSRNFHLMKNGRLGRKAPVLLPCPYPGWEEGHGVWSSAPLGLSFPATCPQHLSPPCPSVS